MLKKRESYLLAGLMLAVLAVFACGPSESQVTQLIDLKVAESERKSASLIEKTVEESDAQAVEAILANERKTMALIEKRQTEMTEDVKALLDEYFDRTNTRVQELVDREGEEIKSSRQASDQEVLRILQDGIESLDEEMLKAIDIMYDDIEELRDSDRLLVGAVCKADYWSNAAFAMMWWTIVYLEGGDAPLEDIKTFANGLTTDDYNEVEEAVCTIDEAGYFRLKGMSEVTDE